MAGVLRGFVELVDLVAAAFAGVAVELVDLVAAAFAGVAVELVDLAAVTFAGVDRVPCELFSRE